MPNHAPLALRAAAEVEQLHAFFVRWLDAVDPDPALTLERFTKVAARSFRLIPPGGAVLGRQAGIDWLTASRASRGSRERPFVIGTDEVEAFEIGPGVCLVTYVERQDGPAGANVRRSTALFRDAAGTPCGVEWLHVHETAIGAGT